MVRHSGRQTSIEDEEENWLCGVRVQQHEKTKGAKRTVTFGPGILPENQVHRGAHVMVCNRKKYK